MKKRRMGIILLAVMMFFAACNGQISNTSGSKEQTTAEEIQNGMNETPTAEESGKSEEYLRVFVDKRLSGFSLFEEVKKALEEEEMKIQLDYADREDFEKLAKTGAGEMFITEDYTLANKLQEKQIIPAWGSLYENPLMLLGPEEVGRDLEHTVAALKEMKRKLYLPSENPEIIGKVEQLKQMMNMEDLEIVTVEGNAMSVVKKAQEDGAYAFLDRAQYFAHESEIKLVIAVEGEESLGNEALVMILPSDGKAEVKENMADKVFEMMKSEEITKLISSYGKEQFGTPLYKMGR